MARRPRRFQSNSNRRMTEWSNFDTGGGTAVAAAGATLLSGLAFESPGTIVRTRGMISIHPTSPDVNVSVAGAFGVGLVSAEAFAAGVASVPTPMTDADWGGWMVMEPFVYHIDGGSGSPTEQTIVSLQINVDSKAMRKVEPNSVMIFIAESLTGAFTVTDLTRLLLMLH